MVPSPSHPSRVEADAPPDDPSRRPGGTSPILTERELLRRTAVLADVRSSKPIPVIFNREDRDLALEAVQGLLLRGQRAAQSIPEPRHMWRDRLDPRWHAKFEPVLRACEVAVLARRPGVHPNPGTQAEIDLLTQRGVPITVYERF